MRVEEALDQVERGVVVPMQFVLPMLGFFEQKRLDLADSSLAEVDDVHERSRAQ